MKNIINNTDLGHVALDIVKNLTRGARTEGVFKEMVVDDVYGVYLIQQEADPLGKKAPTIIRTKVGGLSNKEGHMTFKMKADFLGMIKDEKHAEIVQSFKNDPTGQQALTLAGKTPNDYYNIDFKDEKAREELFQIRYESYKARLPDLFKLDTRTGKYVPKSGTGQKIIDSGHDEETIRQIFNQAIEDGINIGTTNIETVGLPNIMTLVPKDKQQDFVNLFTDDTSEFVNIFGPTISASDSDVVNLGTHDLNQIFPDMGLTGTYELIWNTKTNSLLIK